MELTLKDRVLILNTVLPQFDTRKNMELKVHLHFFLQNKYPSRYDIQGHTELP